MKITLIGAGALGSHVLLFARNLPDPVEWTVVDFDRVERKNVLAQFHSKMVLGRNKAQALQQSLNGLFGVRITAVPHRLTSDNAEQLLGGSGLVVDCVDNSASRQLIQNTVRALGLPCLHGGVAADGSYARILWDERFTIDGGGEGQPTCEGGEHLPFLGLVAARMAQVIQRFVADGDRLSCHLNPAGFIAV